MPHHPFQPTTAGVAGLPPADGTRESLIGAWESGMRTFVNDFLARKLHASFSFLLIVMLVINIRMCLCNVVFIFV